MIKLEGAITDPEAKLLYRLAKRGAIKGAIVEIGSFLGKSTIALAKGSKLVKREKVYAIDPHLGSRVIGKKFSGPTYKKFLTNLKVARVRNWVVPIKKFSFEAIKNWQRPIRLLFIDGNHTYAAVRRDILDWEPWLVEGGIIALHDTLNPAEGVSRATVKYLLETKKLSRLGVMDSIFYGTKGGKIGWRDKLLEKSVKLVVKLLRIKQRWVRQYLVKRWLKIILTKISYG